MGTTTLSRACGLPTGDEQTIAKNKAMIHVGGGLMADSRERRNGSLCIRDNSAEIPLSLKLAAYRQIC